MEEEIEISYLEHELENNSELCIEYLTSLIQVDAQYSEKRQEMIKNLKKAKVAAYLTAGTFDVCSFLAAMSILNSNNSEHPLVDAFLVPIVFTGGVLIMSNKAKNIIRQEERDFKIKIDELNSEYAYYGDRYLEECMRITGECCELQSQYKTLSKTLETNKRISQ